MLRARQNMSEVVKCSSWQKVLRNKCGNNCCGINKTVCGINNCEEDRKLYTKRKKNCFSLFRKTKKAHYENLHEQIKDFDFDPIAEKVKDSTFNATLRYKEHPSILAIWTRYDRNGAFSFSKVSLKQSEAKISGLKRNKVSQYSDIPTKIINKNSDFFKFHLWEY